MAETAFSEPTVRTRAGSISNKELRYPVEPYPTPPPTPFQTKNSSLPHPHVLRLSSYPINNGGRTRAAHHPCSALFGMDILGGLLTDET